MLEKAEYALHGQLLEKADTYNYGIVVLEIISGRKEKARKGQSKKKFPMGQALILDGHFCMEY